MNRNNLQSRAIAARDSFRNLVTSTRAKASAAGTALMVGAGSAMASATGPGDAIAGQLADGPSQLGIVFAAVAVLIGLLILWAYMKRAR